MNKVLALNSADYKFIDWLNTYQSKVPTQFLGEDWYRKTKKLKTFIEENSLEESVTFSDPRLIAIAFEMMMRLGNRVQSRLVNWFILREYLHTYELQDSEEINTYKEWVDSYMAYNFTDARPEEEVLAEYNAKAEYILQSGINDIIPEFVEHELSANVKVEQVEEEVEDVELLKEVSRIMLKYTKGSVKKEWQSLLDSLSVKMKRGGGVGKNKLTDLQKRFYERIKNSPTNSIYTYNLDRYARMALEDLYSMDLVSRRYIKGTQEAEYTLKFERGGSFDGYEIVVVAKGLEKDGGQIIKDRFYINSDNVTKAKEIAKEMWEKEMYNSDFHITEILTDEEYRQKYLSKKFDTGGGVGKKPKTEYTISDFIKLQKQKLREHNSKAHPDDQLDWNDWKYEIENSEAKDYGIFFNKRMKDNNGDMGVFEYMPINKNYTEYFATGGGVEDENREMVLNQNKQIKHHTEELPKAVKKSKHVPAWVVAKVNRSANDISDATHYLDGEDQYKTGGNMTNKWFKN